MRSVGGDEMDDFISAPKVGISNTTPQTQPAL
jgi:hypothetical protein